MWEKEVRLLIKTLEDKFNIEITEDKIENNFIWNKFRDLFGICLVSKLILLQLQDLMPIGT